MTLRTAWMARLKLFADADKLWAEGAKLWAEGHKLWAEAILETAGNIMLEWKWRDGVLDCHLSTGEIFKGDEPLDGAAP